MKMGVAEEIRKEQDKDAMFTRANELIVELYNEKTHFVYELLQNAEDAKASTVRFIMHNDKLLFLHDGLPFTKSNLKAICDIAHSDKNNENKDEIPHIGTFGVGFKAVYTICNTVKLYSEPSRSRHPIQSPLPRFAVEIKDYTVPEDINAEWSIPDDYTTKFEFDYNAGCKGQYDSEDELRCALKKMLSKLGAEVMLYLKHIKAIEYSVYVDDTPKHGKYTLERQDKGNGCTEITTQDSTYLMYSKEYEKTGKTVDLVFEIENNLNDIKFVDAGAKHKYISVYFPTDKESKLKFMIQAPFSTTPNRSNIRDDKKINQRLVEHTTVLLGDVVEDIKNRQGWLSLEFLNILPYDGQWKDELLCPLHDKCIELFKNNEFLPTINGNFVKASDAYIAYSKDLTEKFDGEKLRILVGNPNAEWMPTKLTHSNFRELHDFLTNKESINVQELDVNKVASLIREHPLPWTVVDDKWLADFYNWLAESHAASLGKGNSFATVPFIKISERDVFEAAYSVEYEIDKFGKRRSIWTPELFRNPKGPSSIARDLRYVDQDIEKGCGEFLNTMGIKEPNLYDYFVAKLNDPNAIVSEDDEVSIVINATELLQTTVDEEKRQKLIKECNSKLKLRYIDLDGVSNIETPTTAKIYFVSDVVVKIKISEYLGSIKMYFDKSKIGVLDEAFYYGKGMTQDQLNLLAKLDKMNNTVIDFGPDKWKAGAEHKNEGNFKRWLNFEYIDYMLSSSIDRNKSGLLFEMLKEVENHLKGTYTTRKYRFSGKSEILVKLKHERWLYCKGSKYPSKACDVTRNQLDPTLYGEINTSSNIYDIVGIDKNPEEKAKDVEEMVKDYPDDIKQKFMMNVAKSLSSEKQSEFVREIKQKISSDIWKPIFEQTVENTDNYDSDPAGDNPEFPQEPLDDIDKKALAEKIKNGYHSAKPVDYEVRPRRIRISKESDWYIRSTYDGICQMCRCRNGHPYRTQLFETPSKELHPKELQQMYLSLCPNCAAKYREYRKKDNFKTNFSEKIMLPSLLKEWIENDEIPYVQLDPDKDTNIYFTEYHLFQIKILLQEMEKEEQI